MWSGLTRTSIVHTKWHVDPSSRLTTIDMGQKVGGGFCSLITCLNCTVINWTVITNRNVTVALTRFWLSRFQLYRYRREFYCPEFDCRDIVRIPLHVRKCLHIGNRTYNSSHCMSGTRRAVSNTKRREVSFFSAHKRPSPFFWYTPHKKPSSKPINDQLIVCRWHMLSTAKSANVGFAAGNAIICPTHKPCYAPRAENPFYKFGKKLMWVSTICAQILGFRGLGLGFRVRVSVRVSLVWLVSGSSLVGLCRHLENA